MIATEDLDEQNQVMVKQLKNRYNDTAINRKFLLEINRAKMKLMDVKQEDQNLIESNQTDDEQLGSGFNGKNFDDKFSVPNKQKFTDWNM